jgi:hypothetical protein
MKQKPKITVDYKKHRIKPSKFECNDVKAKQEWREFVENFAKLVSEVVDLKDFLK